MKYIAFDTSSECLSVICSNGIKTEKVFLSDCSFQHSVTLLENIESCLTKLEMRVCDCDLVCTVVGPGSFTGIRIGVASAKGFCDASKAKALQITSFEAIAYADNVGGKVLAVIDARHDNFYIQGFDDLKQSLEPQFVTLDELSKIEGYRFLSAKPIENVKTEIVDVSLGFEKAVNANFDKAIDSEQLKPFYLRLSQAEEGRR